jgi:dTDP-4-amino-4,6-dideoxygalactose transaminase
MIKYADPKLTKEDIRAVSSALEEGHIATGFYVKKFEEACRDKWGGHWCAVSSGTAAISIVAKSIGSMDGATFKVPAFTFNATFEAMGPSIKKCPVEWKDCGRWFTRGQEMSPWVSVSLGGFPMKSFDSPYCANIADNCQSFGVRDIMRWDSARIQCFSFSASKVITCGHGGIIKFRNDDPEFLDFARLARNHGKVGKEYVHNPGGFNYMLADPLAACLLSQLKRVDKIVHDRWETAAALQKACKVSGPFGPTMRMAILETEKRRDSVRKKLTAAGVETRLPYKGNKDFTERGLFLPTGILSRDEIATIARCFR